MTWFSKEQMQQLKCLLDTELTRLESHMNTEIDNVNEQLRNVNEQLRNVNEQLRNVNERLVNLRDNETKTDPLHYS